MHCIIVYKQVTLRVHKIYNIIYNPSSHTFALFVQDCSRVTSKILQCHISNNGIHA